MPREGVNVLNVVSKLRARIERRQGERCWVYWKCQPAPTREAGFVRPMERSLSH